MLQSEEKCPRAGEMLSTSSFQNHLSKVEKHQCLAFPGPARDVPLIDPAACGGGGGYGAAAGGGGGHHGGGGAGFSTGGGGDVGGYAVPNPGYASAGSSQAYIVQDVGQGYSLPQQQQSATQVSSNYDGGPSGGHVAFSGGYVAPTGGGQGAATGGYSGPTGGFSSPSSGLGQSGGGYAGGNGGLVDTYGYDAYDDVGRLVTRDTQV